MRRWFAIVLLVLMPLQLSWAAVAPFCAGEPAGQAQHFGHHAHGHSQVTVDSADTSSLPDLDAATDDLVAGADSCDHCHTTFGTSLVSVAVFAAALPELTLHSLDGPAIRAVAAAPPERPQWASLA
jgi:hypothetical protein